MWKPLREGMAGVEGVLKLREALRGARGKGVVGRCLVCALSYVVSGFHIMTRRDGWRWVSGVVRVAFCTPGISVYAWVVFARRSPPEESRGPTGGSYPQDEYNSPLS